MNELLQTLTTAVGVSGDEYEVRGVLRDLIAPHVDEWHVDPLGNLIALKKGTGESDLRVLIDAHMDEIGLIVTGIDGNGTLSFETVGGISGLTLAGQAVQVGRKKLPGVIGLKPIHLTKTPAERTQIPKLDSLRIDIGAADKSAAGSHVQIGDRATFLAPYSEIGDPDADGAIGPSAIAKALDNRAGCAAIVELLRGARYPFDLYASFSVQEEVGLRGAVVVGYAVQPDVALILECTPAYDLPNDLDIGSNTELGKGPALYQMDAGAIQDPRLVQHLLRAAAAHAIPVQLRRPGGGGTNTGPIQRAALGCAAATIGLPGRHAHTAATLINLHDYAHYVRLTDVALRTLTRALLDRRRPTAATTTAPDDK